jgi:hypothetical protein
MRPGFFRSIYVSSIGIESFYLDRAFKLNGLDRLYINRDPIQITIHILF